MICFKCGGEYRQVWKSGKLQPLNTSDNRLHYLTCQARGKNRPRNRVLRKATKKALVREAAPINTLNHKSAAPIRGRHFRPSCPECTALPWEPCRCFGTQFNAEKINKELDEKFQLEIWENAA